MSNIDEINFTTINHIARKTFGLSFLEYCTADIIYHLSNNPASQHLGWCYASKDWFAKTLSISRMQVHRILNKLEEKGLIIRESESKYIKTTPLWYSEAIINKSKDSNKMLQPVTKGYSDSNISLQSGVTSMLHNIDSNKDNYKTVTKNGIFKLPLIQLRSGEISFIVGEIERLTKDHHSHEYFVQVAKRIPADVIYTTLSEIKHDGAENPAKLFVYKINKYVLLHAEKSSGAAYA